MTNENDKSIHFSDVRASAEEKLSKGAKNQKRLELLKNIGTITAVTILGGAVLFGIGLAVGVFGGEPTKTS